jgi:hypothetical protein
MKKFTILFSIVFLFACTDTVFAQTLGLTSTGGTSYPTAKVMTTHGVPFISTSQSKFGGASGSFAYASSQYLTTPDSPDWYFGTGDFTLDMWVRFNTLPGSGAYVVLINQYVDVNHHWEYYLWHNPTSGDLEWHFENCSSVSPEFTVYISRITTLSTGTWYHIACVRNGNTWYLFQNGVSLTGIPPSPPNLPQLTNGAVSDFTIDLSIGGHFPPGDYLNGYLDEIRISKGVARWTSGFTPPTARYDRDASTVLLLHMDPVSGSTTTFLDDVTTGQAKATKATLPVNASISSMSFYSHTAGNVRLAIYNDASLAPSAKQWESGVVAVTTSAWTTVNISSGTPSSRTLASGTYWLAWQWNPGTAYTAGPSYTAGSSGDGNYLYQSYTGFPSPWIGGTSSSEKWSIYATYCTLPDAPGSIYCYSFIICQGYKGIPYSVDLIGNATGYTWNLPAGATIASGTNTNSITVDFGSSAVSGNITVYGTNTCGSGTISQPCPVTISVDY